MAAISIRPWLSRSLSSCHGRADNESMDAPRGSAGREESDQFERSRQRGYGPDADIAADGVERELNDLRARAYGPEADIEADAFAVARLIELEAANVAAGPPVGATASVDHRTADAAPTSAPALEDTAVSPTAQRAEPMIPATSDMGSGRSLRQRATLTRSRASFMVGSIVVVAILIYAAVWLLSPHPEASLQATAAGPESSDVQALTANVGDPDMSTLHHFERYRDIEVWSVENGVGDICLIAWDRGGGRFEFQCLPPGIELAVHMRVVAEAADGFGDWLADRSVISLHLRKDTVDVFVHPPPPD
ncbi:hypothetical protein [Microbacterium sp. B35-30]|uniref:hypothetical protein n=1 Tax=Microbacterium sp. B35-30 TaxID=1962642 RepID=UPI0013D7917C|nr:hypothetical protein [Microbacterium sp. B35-30]